MSRPRAAVLHIDPHVRDAAAWQLWLELVARTPHTSVPPAPIPLAFWLTGPFVARPVRFGAAVLGHGVLQLLDDDLLRLAPPARAVTPALRRALEAGQAGSAVVTRTMTVVQTDRVAARQIVALDTSLPGINAPLEGTPAAREYARWRLLRALAERFRAADARGDDGPPPELDVPADGMPTDPGEVPVGSTAGSEAVRWLVERGLLSRTDNDRPTDVVRVTPLLAAWLRWVVTREEGSPLGWPPPEPSPRHRERVLRRVWGILARRLTEAGANETGVRGEVRVPLADLLADLGIGGLEAGEAVPAVAEEVAAGRIRVDPSANVICNLIMSVNGQGIDHLSGDEYKQVVQALKRGLVPVGDSREGRIYLSATPQELKELGLPEGWAATAPAPVAAAPRNRERKPKWNGLLNELMMRGESKKLTRRARVLRPIIEALHDRQWERRIPYPRPTGTTFETAKASVAQAFKKTPIWVKLAGNDTDANWQLTWGWW